ncbi:MAG: inositol-phosphate phosphatase [Candidatus Aenigmarchaeota archaeon]|nr:inositol-phosphate phosphatase [Candidatus Aenigmarchaeota archaeon]
MKELEVAIKAAKESGKILSKYFRTNLKVDRKSDKSPVTIADKESENEIVSIIKESFPEHNFLGEEFSYEKTKSEFTWIIDPLDGTKCFVHGLPFFGNCIGLEKNGKIVAGVINMPEMGTLAFAEKSGGTFVNGKKVKVSDVGTLEDAYVVFGDVDELFRNNYGNRFLQLLGKCQGHRGYADTLGYILLAQGYVDILIDGPKPWDVAAAKIIVEEAGGKFTDFEGKSTIYSDHTIATNGKIHKNVVDIFGKI